MTRSVHRSCARITTIFALSSLSFLLSGCQPPCLESLECSSTDGDQASGAMCLRIPGDGFGFPGFPEAYNVDLFPEFPSFAPGRLSFTFVAFVPLPGALVFLGMTVPAKPLDLPVSLEVGRLPLDTPHASFEFALGAGTANSFEIPNFGYLCAEGGTFELQEFEQTDGHVRFVAEFTLDLSGFVQGEFDEITVVGTGKVCYDGPP